MRRRSFCATSLNSACPARRALQWGATAPDRRPTVARLRHPATQGPGELAAGSRPTPLRSRGPQRGEQSDRARTAITRRRASSPARRQMASVQHVWRNGFGFHDGSLLYLVCTDWRVTPKRRQSAATTSPFPADATCFASTSQPGDATPTRPVADRRIIRREIHVEFVDVHNCQYRLTAVVCQLN